MRVHRAGEGGRSNYELADVEFFLVVTIICRVGSTPDLKIRSGVNWGCSVFLFSCSFRPRLKVGVLIREPR